VVDSFLYACGGDSWDGTSLIARRHVERLNLINPIGWTTMASLPDSCGQTRAFGFGTGTRYYVSNPGDLERKIVIAGRGFWVSEDSSCYTYDVASNTWSRFPVLVRACRNHAAALIPGTDSANGIPGMWVWGGRHTGDDVIGDTSQFFQLRYHAPPAHDVGCVRIPSPVGLVDSNTSVVPACTLMNYGTTAESYSVRIRIGSFFDTVAAVSGHVAGTMIAVSFPSWSVHQTPGTYPVTCSTELATDANLENDWSTDSVTIIVPDHDVGVTAIVAPQGRCDSGSTVTPACSTYNYGTTLENYQVRMVIGASYDQTVPVIGHAPGTSFYLEFPSWIAHERGNNQVLCRTELSGDENGYNDERRAAAWVRVTDVSAESIIRPVRRVELYDTTYPLLRVMNRGTDSASFTIAMRIGEEWRQQRTKVLAPGNRDTALMPIWIPTTVGRFWMACSLVLAGDMIPANNELSDSVTVIPGSGENEKDYARTQYRAALHGIRPNPARNQAIIPYCLPEAGCCRLAIYDTRGRLVRDLVTGARKPGSQEAIWDCCDKQAQKVPAGVYFCRLQFRDQLDSRKLLVTE
ncbi:MAG: hypothetical protein ABIK62_05325, partial [candidate division WOR-3 bacterium]